MSRSASTYDCTAKRRGKQPNPVRIVGDTAYIGLTPTDGKPAEFRVNVEDIGLVEAFPRRWFAMGSGAGFWYVSSYDGPKAKKTLVQLHRYLMQATPGMDVDHINGDTLDNRRENLRLVTRSQNCQNSRKTRAVSGHKHVHWHKNMKRWVVNVTVDGRTHYGGCFKEKEDAIEVARNARITLHSHCPENSPEVAR